MTSSSSGSCSLPSIFLRQDLGLANHQLVAFAPHHFDQNGQLQFAAPHHFECVRTAGLFHADGDIGQQFLVQPVAQITRRDELSFAAGERRVLTVNVMAIVGSSIWMCGSGFRSLRAGDGFADGDAFDARDREDVAGPADGFVDALQALERVQLRDPCLLNEPSSLQMRDFIAVPQRAVENAANGEPARDNRCNRDWRPGAAACRPDRPRGLECASESPRKAAADCRFRLRATAWRCPPSRSCRQPETRAGLRVASRSMNRS